MPDSKLSLRASFALNAVLSAAFLIAMVALFALRSAATRSATEAANWKQIAAESTVAYVESHGGMLPKGTRVLDDNGSTYIIGFTKAN